MLKKIGTLGTKFVQNLRRLAARGAIKIVNGRYFLAKQAAPLFRGSGAFDVPKTELDKKREHFFGNKSDRKIPDYFDNSQTLSVLDQFTSMACTLFSMIAVLRWKFWKATGEKLKITTKFVLAMWDVMVKLKYGDKRRGAKITSPLEFMSDYPQLFITEKGEKVKIWIEDFFRVDEDDPDFWQEVRYGGGVLTGTSSRLGLQLKFAKYIPFIPKSQKAMVNDGHAFPIMGKGYSWPMLVNRIQKTVHDVEAAVHRNSYGEDWGNEGNFYTTEEQRDNLFTFWGFTIGYEFENKKETKNIPQVEPEKKIFKDVGEGSWAAEGIKWAVENGIFKGYGDESLKPEQKEFLPEKPITRAETAVVLKRMFDLLKKQP